MPGIAGAAGRSRTGCREDELSVIADLWWESLRALTRQIQSTFSVAVAKANGSYRCAAEDGHVTPRAAALPHTGVPQSTSSLLLFVAKKPIIIAAPVCYQLASECLMVAFISLR